MEEFQKDSGNEECERAARTALKMVRCSRSLRLFSCG